MMNAKRLRDTTNKSAKNVFISPDLSKEERIAQKALRDEKRARGNKGDTNLIIRAGRIITKNP